MKGVSLLLSHVIYLVIGFIAIGVIVASVSTYRSNLRQTSFKSQLDLAAEVVKANILMLYSASNTSGKIEIPLEERIGQYRYTIILNQTTLNVTLNTGNSVLYSNLTINISANLNGSANLPAYLVLSKSDSTKTITVTK